MQIIICGFLRYNQFFVYRILVSVCKLNANNITDKWQTVIKGKVKEMLSAYVSRYNAIQADLAAGTVRQCHKNSR